MTDIHTDARPLVIPAEMIVRARQAAWDIYVIRRLSGEDSAAARYKSDMDAINALQGANESQTA